MGQIYMQLEMERFIELKKAEKENKKLREALEFYADEKNHIAPIFDEHGQYNGSKVDKDGGEIARQALGGEANE